MLLAVVSYVALFVLSRGALIFGERTFVSKPVAGSEPVNAYVEVLGIDPVRQALRLKLDVANGTGLHGTHYFGTSTRDLDLHISDGNTEQDVAIRRNSPMPSTLFESDLEGNVGNYPFDRYSVRTRFTASERTAGKAARPVPLRLTLWDDQPAWVLDLTTPDAPGEPAALALAFNLRRAMPLLLFASAMYGVMILVAVIALSIAALTASERKRSEATLIGALAAMVFALPALRNTLPGTPPLGVRADLFIFLWAELGVVIALAVLVFAWSRQGKNGAR